MPLPRRSTLLGVGLMAGAGVVVVLALLTAKAPQRPPTSVEPAVAAELPTTIATTILTTPAIALSVDTHEQRRAANPAPPSSVSTLPVSPLASQLPKRVSAVPRVATVTAPVLLAAPDIGLVVSVRDIGVEPDGELEIPDETEVGWYRLGSSPGRAGATVLAGHVSWNDTTGPFFRLADLQPGAAIELGLEDGTSRRYTVIERAQYPKLMLPKERIWARTGEEALVLITCGGEFNRAIRRYTDNVVVYAVPIASTR